MGGQGGGFQPGGRAKGLTGLAGDAGSGGMAGTGTLLVFGIEASAGSGRGCSGIESADWAELTSLT